MPNDSFVLKVRHFLGGCLGSRVQSAILRPALWTGVLAFAISAGAAQPNIVFILTDDQGYGELSCHGNPILKTPHLDRLHRESARFVDFQVSPTCAPTRAALMTGRHEFKSGVTHTILERERLSLKATTLAEALRSAGYATGIFGKWHLGDEAEYQPERRGFDEVFIHGAGGIGQTYPGSGGDAPGNRYHNPVVLHNGQFERTEGFCTDVFFKQAMAWIDGQRKTQKPFFAYITPNAPHSPYISPGPEYDRLFADAGLTEDQVAYYGMIRNIDDNVGRLLEKLGELGIENETLVIFMTDNGHSIRPLYNAGMRGTKGTVYQGGVRVPSFWRWPGQIPAGDRKQLAAHIDVFPTFAEITGAKLADSVRKSFDGRSLLPVLKDPNAPWADRTLFIHLGRWEVGNASESRHRHCAVRNSRFKLVNDSELYDLENDPGEMRDVSAEHPKVVARLRSAYDAWWESILPCLENEDVTGPKINPFKQRYWEQFGGEPDQALLQRMNPKSKFQPRSKW